MKSKIHIYSTENELADHLGKRLKRIITFHNKKKKTTNIMISGGNTPKNIFQKIASDHSSKINWNRTHFFWVDERCVPSDHAESNYGQANQHFFQKIDIPLHNVHPIVGESHPYLEADRYSSIVQNHFQGFEEVPVFDMIFLGMGTDGHTASIFPNQIDLFESNRLFEVAEHPESGQKRITVTGKVINNAREIIFLVTGSSKAKLIKQILNKEYEARKYPANYVIPENGKLEWLMDKEASQLIE